MESLDFVSFITGFSLVQVMENEGARLEQEGQYKIYDTVRDPANLPTVYASTPWSVLIPIAQHAIHFIYNHKYEYPSPAGVSNMSIGSDFVISAEAELDFVFDDFRNKLEKKESSVGSEEYLLTIDFSED
jgi:hypothetical protein